VSALGIQVETFRGDVQLSGYANSPSEIDRAAQIARKVEGVRDVKNDIRLKSGS
jgi:osmotically-inducible protein OsmY